MLHRILSLAGYRTALYTSPHLVSFTERIRVGDEEISQDEVVGLAEEIWHRTAAADVALTFLNSSRSWRLFTLPGATIDVAVIEVGLGGRFDATNLVAARGVIDYDNFQRSRGLSRSRRAFYRS